MQPASPMLCRQPAGRMLLCSSAHGWVCQRSVFLLAQIKGMNMTIGNAGAAQGCLTITECCLIFLVLQAGMDA